MEVLRAASGWLDLGLADEALVELNELPFEQQTNRDVLELLPITKTEAGLAVVMGHEISHAIASHGNERMSAQMLQELGFSALDVAMANKPEKTRSIFESAVGMGAELGIMLPFSRRQESEADRMGLIFMAMAGYDPNEAVNFWTRMAVQSGGQSVPEFLSTHPSDETRINDIQTKYLPEAMKYYKK